MRASEVRVLDYPPFFFWPLVQPAGRLTVNEDGLSSNLRGSAIFTGSSSSDRTLDCLSKNGGLIPLGPAMFPQIASVTLARQAPTLEEWVKFLRFLPSSKRSDGHSSQVYSRR